MTGEPFGTTRDGRPVRRHRLLNASGTRVSVLDYGGAITEIMVPDRAGTRANVVVGLPDVAAMEALGFANVLVGRHANRLRGGVTIDGRHFPLDADANGVTLHGGGRPWGARTWTVAQDRADALRLSLVSPDGDQGFPGRVQVTVDYRLGGDDTLTLDYRATTDAPTVVALTSHLWFNLGGSGSGSVDAHHLLIAADAYTPVDQLLIPTGELRPVAGTPFDFRTGAAIGAGVRADDPQLRIARGYDHNFVLREGRGTVPRPAARLHDPGSGRTLDIATTEPGLQLYSGNGLDGGIVTAGGRTLRQGDAVVIETQAFPNTPNVPAFGPSVLRPGETWRSTTRYRFGVGD